MGDTGISELPSSLSRCKGDTNVRGYDKRQKSSYNFQYMKLETKFVDDEASKKLT